MKKILAILLLIPSLVCAAPLIENATAIGAGQPVLNDGGRSWFQASLSGTSPSSVITVEGSDDKVTWIPVATIIMPVSIIRSVVYAIPRQAWIRGNVVSLTGAGASVTLISGK